MRYSPTESPGTQMPQTVSFEFNRNIAQMSCTQLFLQQISLISTNICMLFDLYLFCSLLLEKKNKNYLETHIDLQRKAHCLSNTINENNEAIDVTMEQPNVFLTYKDEPIAVTWNNF